MITTHGQFGGTEDDVYILVTEVPANYEQKWLSALKENSDRISVLEATPQVTDEVDGVSFTADVLKLRAEYQERKNHHNQIPKRETALVMTVDGVREMDGYKIFAKSLQEQGRQFAKDQFRVIHADSNKAGSRLIRVDENCKLLGWRFNTVAN